MEKHKRRFIFSVLVQDIVAIPLARFLIKSNFKANYVSLIGLVFAIVSGLCYLGQYYTIGAVLFFGALILDSTDGRVARGTNTFSDFGALLDSVADKIRSFFVAACLLASLGLDLSHVILIFSYYISLPILRLILSNRNSEFYDPTILFWDATPFKYWFVKKGVLGFYTGWERSVACLVLAPLVVNKIEVFIGAIALEQLLFIIGLLFCKKYKVGI